jgi:pyridoxamine 5'-phosphate oxidase
MNTIADLRRDYTTGGLSEADAGDDPFVLFRTWFDTAMTAKLPEPNAMALATVAANGRPSVRIVLLKGIDHGLTFFTNYDSRKAQELGINPFAAVTFLWDELERQVRVEGHVEKTCEAESDTYYHSRPMGSRLGAWASQQSGVIPDRAFLERQQAELLAKYPNGDPPRPPFWGGFRLIPDAFEFWQGRPSRLHDRLRYRLATGRWVRERLSP